jgi:hypothetical protein
MPSSDMVLILTGSVASEHQIIRRECLISVTPNFLDKCVLHSMFTKLHPGVSSLIFFIPSFQEHATAQSMSYVVACSQTAAAFSLTKN